MTKMNTNVTVNINAEYVDRVYDMLFDPSHHKYGEEVKTKFTKLLTNVCQKFGMIPDRVLNKLRSRIINVSAGLEEGLMPVRSVDMVEYIMGVSYQFDDDDPQVAYLASQEGYIREAIECLLGATGKDIDVDSFIAICRR